MLPSHKDRLPMLSFKEIVRREAQMKKNPALPVKPQPEAFKGPFHDLQVKAVDGVVHRPSKRPKTKYKCLRCDKIEGMEFFAAVAKRRSPSQGEPYRAFGLCWKCCADQERQEADKLPSTKEARSF